jgi:chorismate lyase/3-hydroxybenzoate synthase
MELQSILAPPAIDEPAAQGAEARRVYPVLEPLNFSRYQADDRVLGMIGFGAAAEAAGCGKAPCAIIDMPVLGSSTARMEVWRGSRPATYGEASGIHYAENGEVLFGLLSLSAAAIDDAAYRAYRRLIGFAREAGYPHLVRVWNHFPAIDEEQEGLERYQRFCLGRYQAFAEAGYAFGADLPAASALGTESGEFCLYFIAAHHASRQLENPRQLSAYRYPSCYGPRSPSFSRAALMGDQLFISGTSSIAGHETLHAGKVAAQCMETLENLRAVLAQAGCGTALDQAHAVWKVYLRSTAHFETVRNILGPELGPESEVLFLKGDICRANLLLEIEGVVSGVQASRLVATERLMALPHSSGERRKSPSPGDEV